MLENSQVSILCIEGNRNNHFAFSSGLERRGYQVRTVGCGADGIALLPEMSPMLIVINAASLRTNGIRITGAFGRCCLSAPLC